MTHLRTEKSNPQKETMLEVPPFKSLKKSICMAKSMSIQLTRQGQQNNSQDLLLARKVDVIPSFSQPKDLHSRTEGPTLGRQKIIKNEPKVGVKVVVYW